MPPTTGAKGKDFAERVRSVVSDEPLAAQGIEAPLTSWEAIAEQVGGLDRLLSGLARHDPVCRDILMTAPGVLSRVKRANGPCAWAAALAERVGVGKARVVVGYRRKLT